MSSGWRHTIVRIVRTRSKTQTRRPVRPDSVEDFFAEQHPPIRREPSVSGRRSRGRRAIVGSIIAAVVLVAGIVAALVLTMPSIGEVEPTGVTKDHAPQLDFVVAHPFRLTASKVSVRIDGHAVAPSAISVSSGGSVSVDTPRLADGRHDVSATVDGVGVLRLAMHHRWSITVDTVAPEVRTTSPAPATADDAGTYDEVGVVAITKLPITVTAKTEAGAGFSLASSRASVEPVHDGVSDSTTRSAKITLPEGAQTLLVQSTDAAGNTGVQRIPVVVDTTAPAILGKVPALVKDAHLGLELRTTDAHGTRMTAQVDGKDVADGDLEVTDSTPPAAAGATADDAATATPTPTAGDTLPIAATYVLKVQDPLYEGRHTLQLTTTDSLGATRTIKRAFLVDAAETLDAAAGIKGGARGKDVTALQTELIRQEMTTKAALGAEFTGRTYGLRTKAAVQKLQQSKGVAADGVAGADTLAALTLKLVVDRAAHTLTLYRAGAVVKTWGVAVGSPQYPTPAGSFKIQSMQENPTWTPPDSVWAKGAKAIGPGPDNPLGTRWMGIDGTVGIHGTNSPASIGFSVSHGCIRMRIPDVEDVFSRVRVGTPVEVR